MPDNHYVYIDTSVLVKRFVEEDYSTQVDTFFEKNFNFVISELVVLEFECTLRRLQRNSKITQEYRLKASQALTQQINDKWFEKAVFSNQLFTDAKHLIEQVSPLALRSLDALHLAIMQSGNIKQLTTADDEMRKAADHLGLTIHYFNH